MDLLYDGNMSNGCHRWRDLWPGRESDSPRASPGGDCQRSDASEGHRRICILNEERHLLDIPISTEDPASVANALEAPILAAIRAVGSLLNECTVEVEKTDETPRPPEEKAPES